MKRIYQWVCWVMLGMVLAGCGFMPQVSAVEGQEQTDALAYIEPMTDAVLAGYNAQDYAKFSQDFDAGMLKALKQPAFEEMMAVFNEKLGAYQSRSVRTLRRVDEVIMVEYEAKFEKEEKVTIQLSVSEQGTHYITGLWFDSPKLQEK